MKTGALFILFFLAFTGSVKAHPIHVSITNMDLLQDSNRIDISIGMYYDDFQSLINYQYNTMIDFSSYNRLTSKEQSAILDYIAKSFQLLNNKNDTLATDFLGWKKENQTIWLLFCTDISPEIAEIRIRNALMLDLFDNQSNLIIFRQNGQEKGLEFDKRTTVQSIVLK